ncbi:MAG: sulfotransferase [Rhodothermia bacterium]
MTAILPHLIKVRLGAGPSLVRKASAGLLMARRTLTQLVSNGSGDKAILLIFGCQRSGTTMLSRIFEGDARVSPFAEHTGELSRPDHLLRLRDLESVGQVFDRSRGQLVVAKPLVESQRADEILEHFSSARAIWMYRDYRDVVRSYVRIFGRAGINISRKIVTGADNWASERLSDSVREVVETFYSEEMSAFDAAALFWWIRNGWFFDLSLRDHPRVMLCRYETLVSSPDPVMRSIYDFAQITYPGAHLINGVHPSSKGLGNSIKIDPEIDKLCRERLAALDAAAGVAAELEG